jgi:hypothetical protein
MVLVKADKIEAGVAPDQTSCQMAEVNEGWQKPACYRGERLYEIEGARIGLPERRGHDGPFPRRRN